MRLVILTLVTACLLAAAPAYAQTEGGFELGLELFNYKYTEPLNGSSTLDEQHGPSLGLVADYTWRSAFAFLTLDGRASLTRATYSAANVPSVSGVQNPVYEFRGVVGHDFLVAPNVAASPYAGIGYRSLHDDIDGGRTEHYLYAPVGVSFAIADGDWVFRPSVEYDYFFNGTNKTQTSKIGYSKDVTFKQDSGYGLRAAFLAETPTAWGRVAFGPFVRYWNIDKSSIDSTASTTCGTLSYGCVFGTGTVNLLEPSNHTIEVGVEVKVGL